MEISRAKSTDVNDIVKIHQEAFKDFFLSSLGERFLRIYYSSFIKSNDGVVLCAKKNDNLIGFSACSYMSRGFNSSLILHNLAKFGIEIFMLLFSKPKALVRLAKNMNKESDDTTIDDKGDYAELYSIAVSPSCQGEGVGKKLISATEEVVKKHNDSISLTTDFYNNDKTIAFYHVLGYENYYEFVTYPKRKMWRMIKKLS